ncbi:CusA/CzcA family heavy metal efflux RND transporter [Cesiribacter sp. SM1]|uniref:CusA/CzcA family heavy metal efflux RND transporter n=1 Tax=Cesiribacter sp. SM1 TaxID=2861196 RepID=UPI001CD5ABBB|nr:CusA/CzcA family heavy metal efflux RND transporter [Cesiribacter sp. SM1]
MIDNIIAYSIRHKLVIGLGTLGLIIAGFWAMQKVPVDAVPDITNNQVQIITVAPTLGTVDVEQFITYQVELAMANLPGVEEIRSVSRFGLSVVTVVFEDDMGNFLPRQLVGEKLLEVNEAIPPGMGEPFIGPISTGLGEIFQYTLEVDPAYKNQYSAAELRSIQDWIVKRQMAMVPGVVEVNSFGGQLKQYEVAVDPDRLRSMNLSIADVFEAISRNNQNSGGAYIERQHQAYFIRSEGLIESIEDIESIVVDTREGIPLLVGDVAQVGFGSGIRYGALTKGGKGEAVGGMILMLKGANSNEVIENVKERMQQVAASLPAGVSIEPFLDRSSLISNTTSTVSTNLIEGGLIVIFVLVLLLGNWRAGLLVATTIPLSLLFAFIMMYFFDVSANLMSLGAIDFGIIVDGAVIIVESVVFVFATQYKDRSSLSQEERDAVAYKSSKSMMNSAFFGQLIILIVFLPILTLEGIEGKMFRPMALTFGFAIIGAMILCLTYVPMMSALFVRKGKGSRIEIGDKITGWLERKFRPLLHKSLQRAKIVLIGAVALLALTVVGFLGLGGEFLPQLDEGDIAFHAILKPGSSLTETTETTTKIERLLLEQYPEIKQVVSRIGVAEVPTDPMPMDLADIFVILDEEKGIVSADSKEELIEDMKATLNIIPGVSYEFTQPIEMRFNELLTGVREDIAIKLYGDDMQVLSRKAEEICRIVSTIPGVADYKAEATTGLPQIRIQYNRQKLAQYGLDVQQLNTLVETAFGGGQAGVVFEGERRFGLVVRLQESLRQQQGTLENLYVTLPNGSQVPLKEVAQINYEPGPMQIGRENTSRRTYVGINVRGRDVKSLVEEIQQRLDDELQLPAGYYIRYGGAFENLERATARLQIVVPVALLLIFMLIFFALGSFKQAMIIFMAIPLAAIGGVLALWLRDMPFSISAGVGFIVLFGVAVLNGLVLINSLNELKEEGVADLQERILGGTTRRIRPILLTASTDILGFLPMALSTSAGAEVQRPLATVVIGGLLTATLLTLFVLPVLYQWLERRRGNGSSMIGAPAGAAILLLMLIMAAPAATQAQELPVKDSVSLEEALALARDKYPALKAAALEVERQQALQKGSLQLGSTQIFTGGEELGNANGGVYTLIGIGQQDIDVFSTGARKKLQQEQTSVSLRQQALVEQQILQEVRQTFWQAYVAQQQLQLALDLDSLYGEFKRAAQIRYEVMATGKLELLTAQTEYSQVLAMRAQAQAAFRAALVRLTQYTGTPIEGVVVPGELPLPPATELPDSLPAAIPQLAVASAQKSAAEAQNQLLKRERLPDLNLQAGLQQVDGERGFYTYQAGISFPLLNRSQKAQARAAGIQVEIQEQNLQQQQLQVRATYQQLLLEYSSLYQLYLNYQTEVLPQLQEQVQAVRFAYQEGAIDYIALNQNLQGVARMRQAYLQTLEQLLQAHAQLQLYIPQSR